MFCSCLGRPTASYSIGATDDDEWSDALTVTGDYVYQQSESTYDKNSNVLLSVTRQRFDNVSGTGGLGAPATGIYSRVYYAGMYYDGANRLIASVNVGTNGGTAWNASVTSPGSVPARSDTVLVTSVEFDAAGRTFQVTDPRDIKARTYYDLLGRTTKTVQAYVDSGTASDENKTLALAYDGSDHLVLYRAYTSATTYQDTTYDYGVTPGNLNILYSNDLLATVLYPDVNGNEYDPNQFEYSYNAQGQRTRLHDANGTVHEYGFDVEGRSVKDTITSINTSLVDGSVRRLVHLSPSSFSAMAKRWSA